MLVAFWLYLSNHPSVWILGWPILTAVLTALFSDSVVAKMPKPLAWLFRLMKASGLDSRAILSLLASLAASKGIPVPPPPPEMNSPPDTAPVGTTSSSSPSDTAPDAPKG